MQTSHLNSSTLTGAAITALSYAYEKCSDNVAKESIFTAVKAITQLKRDLESHVETGNDNEHDFSCDPSEYCAAV
jgi:hypothetical protein